MAISPQRRLELGRVPPPGHDVWVSIFLAPSGTEQVIDKPLDPLPARRGDLPDHRTVLPECRTGRRTAPSSAERVPGVIG